MAPDRRHHADFLRAGRRSARPRHGRTGQLHLAHQTIKVQGRGRQGQERRSPSTEVPLDKALRIRRRGCRHHPAPVAMLKPRLVAERMTTVYETMERPLVPVLVEMELPASRSTASPCPHVNDFAGAAARPWRRDPRTCRRGLQCRLAQAAWRDPVREMGLPGGKKAKTGAWVHRRRRAGGRSRPRATTIAGSVLDWRQLSKLKSTYTDALADPDQLPETGRVHTSYCDGGRLHRPAVVQRPNLQNIPIRTEEGRKIRYAPSSPRKACADECGLFADRAAPGGA